MKIVIMGPKGVGKSTLGAALADQIGLKAHDTDEIIEALYAEQHGTARTCREIFREEGEDIFRALELQAARQAAEMDWCIVLTGGGLMMNPDARRALRANAVLVLLGADMNTLWKRATANGLPPWLEGEDGRQKYEAQTREREEVLRPYADILFDTATGTPDDQAEALTGLLAEEMAVRSTAPNTCGEILRTTTFGESHGRAIGAVLDGVRPGTAVSEEVIQEQMDRRRPGQSKVVTQRREPDKVEILSGVFEGKATGAPIAMVVYNQDQRSRNYDDLKDVFRPGHGDFTFYEKYGLRDYRGGGRQSGRETACRVAAGAVALDVLRKHGVRIVAHAVEVGGIKAKACDYDTIESNVVRCGDPEAAKRMEQAILDARSGRDSVGGVIQLELHGLPAGLGDPVFGKLDARLVSAIMTIGAIKGVEVGDGFALTRLRGSEANDAMADGKFLSNRTGGILGGISTGEPVVMRIAVKPTASIAQQQNTCDEHGQNREIAVLGRHDPCIVPRAVPVVEGMAALIALDAWEVQCRLNPDWAERHPL